MVKGIMTAGNTDSGRSLDLSFNNFRSVPTLPSLKRLETLYLVQNKIGLIEPGELEWCKETLTSIELGGNRLRAIENIEMLVHLTELWLGKNKIRRLEVSS
jgi:protein phosphatase 1 regulatory subunit 7